MNNYDAFHCRINISRNLPNSITAQDTLHNSLNFFFGSTPTPFISIGSSKKSSIVVEGTKAKHCVFNFQHDSAVITAYDEIFLNTSKGEVCLEKGDIYTLEFSKNKIIEAHTLLEWSLEIRPFTVINITITSEEGLAKKGMEHYLETKYEFAKKIFESERYLIYRVSNKSLVKILHPYHKEEQLQVMEFFRVARQVAEMECNILRKIKSFDEALPHVEIEFFQGETLQNYLAKKGKLSYKEAKMVFTKIIELLQTTAKHDYVCKNLNLDNILCGREKQVKFTGWNMLLVGAMPSSRHALYLAPEYIRGEKPTPLADIYSAGIVLYRMVTGRFPFVSSEDYHKRVLENTPITKDELQTGSAYVTPQTAAILEKMLAFSPEDRPGFYVIENWIEQANDFSLWESVLNMNKTELFFGLQVVSSPKKEIEGQICPLLDNQCFAIGRKADINIPGDTRMSRKHTNIILENGVCTLEDLGSSNGTMVLGDKINKCQIDSGVTFTIGQTTLAFWNFKQLQLQRKRLMNPRPSKISGWHDLRSIVKKS